LICLIKKHTKKDKESELTELKRIINLYKLNGEIARLLNELDKAYSRKHDRTNSFNIDIELNNFNDGAAIKCL
jgi:hypothetical protein